MASDELLARTAQYRVEASVAPPRRGRRDLTQSSQEYINAVRSPLQSLERTTLTNPDSRTDSGNNVAGQNGTDTVNPAASFRVTTDYDETPEEGSPGNQGNDDELPSVAEIERLHMEQMEDDFLCSESDGSDTSEDTAELTVFHRRRRELLRHIRNLEEEAAERRRRDPHYSGIIPSPAAVRYNPEFDTPNRGLLRPYARFFMEPPKKSVSIRFDPPM